MMINAHCHYRGETTLAIHSLNFFRALNRRHDVAMIPLDGEGPLETLPADVARMVTNGRNADPRNPAIGIAPFDLLWQVRGIRRIAFVVWETTIVHPQKITILRTMDEVWTPSQWGRRIFIENGLDADRVHVVPEGVDVNHFKPQPVPREGRPFRFLCVGKWERRKAIDELVDAFCEEFDPREPIDLILHCWNPWIPRFDLAATIAHAMRGRNARIVASSPIDDLRALYNACDAFVLPTRGEGWGLPVVEAMACGLPVIVTNYSAPADYLNDDIAYPIRIESLVDVYDSFFFPEGKAAGQWAQPDFAHLRALMRHVYEHQDEAREKGRRAREAMCNQWTWDHAAAKACAVLGIST
jgi:glycosyltransferase involved in cell wall biosynthesis